MSLELDSTRETAMHPVSRPEEPFRLVHISDLHFGRTDDRVVQALEADLTDQRPDLIVVSGDLTQRARSMQFAEARAFLERLPAPVLVVPGNHDLAPFYHPVRRLLQPRERWRRYMSGDDAHPVFWDDQVLAVGMDSARHLRWVGGGLDQTQIRHLEGMMPAYAKARWRILVMHHPPPLPPHPKARLVDRLGELGFDAVLSGHAHVTRARPGGLSERVLLVQASTAVSTRVRSEGNSYNLLLLRPEGTLTIFRRGWQLDGFGSSARRDFTRGGTGGWHMA